MVEPSLRRLLAWLAFVLLGTAWTVSSYLESRRPHGLAGGWTTEAPSTGASMEELPRAAASGAGTEPVRSQLSVRPNAG